jgi:chromosome segregation ATPase
MSEPIPTDPTASSVRPGQRLSHLAAEERELRQQLAAAEAARREAEADRERMEQEAARKQQAKAAADERLGQDLDKPLAVIRKTLPGFETIAAEIDAAVAQYREAVAPLGLPRSVVDDAIGRHPIARLIPWLRTFAPPQRREP